MKKSFYILFLIIFCWQFVGVFLHFQTSQQLIKNEVKQKLKHKKNLIEISFTKEEYSKIIWIHKGEFKYNSNFYDLKSKKTVNHKVILTCFSDTKEQSLMSDTNLKLNTNKDRNKSDQPNLLWQKITQTNYIKSFHQITFVLNETQIEFKKPSFYYLNKNYFVLIASQIKPPIQV